MYQVLQASAVRQPPAYPYPRPVRVFGCESGFDRTKQEVQSPLSPAYSNL